MRFRTAVCLETAALTYMIRQTWLLYKRINYLEKGKIQQKKLVSFLHTLVMKKECGLKSYFMTKQIRSIAVYGTGIVYQAVSQELADSADIKYFVDKSGLRKSLEGKPVIKKEEIDSMEAVDAILVTAVGFFQEIREELENSEIQNKLIDIEDILYFDVRKKQAEKNHD